VERQKQQVAPQKTWASNDAAFHNVFLNGKLMLRRIFLGMASGVLAGGCCLILAYVVGVVVVAVSLRELFPTILTAGTVLPLMLIVVGIPVTIVLGLLTGALLGAGAALRDKPFGFLPGVIVGALCSVFILSVLLKLIAPPQRDDFVHIVSSPYLSASYGAVLGAITSRLFRWMDRKR
jgi:uncharacterized membrane protein required for colicin V production